MPSQKFKSGANRKTKSKKRLGRMTQVRQGQSGGRGMSQPMSTGVALSRRVQTVAPMISRGNKSMRIRHRELIATTVAGSTSFVVQNVYSINPGLAASFPWLAPQAQQWEQYTVHGIRYIWVPIAPTSTAGDVYLVPDYDASDPTPTTETQASDNVDSVVDSCWQDIVCDLDPKAMMGLGPRRFIRPCAVAGDVKTFDVGKFFLCTNNEAGTSAIGKLFVEYDFEFFEPQNSPSPATAPQGTSVFNYNNDTLVFSTGVAQNLAYDTVVFDPLGIGAPVAGVFTPPAGSYRLEAVTTSTDSVAEVFQSLTQIFKNGAYATTTNRGRVVSDFGAVNASFNEQVNINTGVVTCNGTDTIALNTTLTGAAGTLKVQNTYTNIIWSLA